MRFVRAFGATSFPDVSTMPTTRVTTLDNGIRVATEVGSGETATVGVHVNTGSRYETVENNGVASLLQTVLAKDVNAYTTRESTVYTAQGQGTSKLLGELAAAINAPITEEGVAAGRAATLAEVQDLSVDESLFNRLHAVGYRGHPLSQTVQGPVENIDNLTLEQVSSFKAATYTGRNIVVSGAGAVDHDALVKATAESFGAIPVESNDAPVMQPAHFTGGDVRIQFDSMPECHIAVGFPTCGWTDADHIPLLVIQQLIGSWVRTQSFGAGNHHSNEIIGFASSEWKAESFTTFNTQYSDTGLFGLHVTAHERCVGDICDAIFWQTTQLFYRQDEDELEAAKNRLKVKYLSSLDTTDKTAEDIGRQITSYGRRIHASEMIARIDAVDCRAIKDTAGRFFYDRDFSMATIGPVMEQLEYTTYRQRTFWRAY